MSITREMHGGTYRLRSELIQEGLRRLVYQRETNGWYTILCVDADGIGLPILSRATLGAGRAAIRKLIGPFPIGRA